MYKILRILCKARKSRTFENKGQMKICGRVDLMSSQIVGERCRYFRELQGLMDTGPVTNLIEGHLGFSSFWSYYESKYKMDHVYLREKMPHVAGPGKYGVVEDLRGADIVNCKKDSQDITIGNSQRVRRRRRRKLISRGSFSRARIFCDGRTHFRSSLRGLIARLIKFIFTFNTPRVVNLLTF